MRLGRACQFQFRKCGQHETMRRIDCADDFVDAHGGRAEGFAHGAEQGCGSICIAPSKRSAKGSSKVGGEIPRHAR